MFSCPSRFRVAEDQDGICIVRNCDIRLDGGREMAPSDHSLWGLALILLFVFLLLSVSQFEVYVGSY